MRQSRKFSVQKSAHFVMNSVRRRKSSAQSRSRTIRCLVPVDSFVEWRRVGAKTKLPWLEPNELIAEKTGHDRMPVTVRRQDYQRWLELGDEQQPPMDLVRPFDSDKMKARRVDPKINNVRNTGPDLLNEVKDEGPPNGEEQRGMF